MAGFIKIQDEYSIPPFAQLLIVEIIIDALKLAGYDIVCTRTPKAGFFLASRDFEEAEVRLMIDAVQAAKFITAKKTDSLVNKIGGLLSEPQASKLKSQVYIDKSHKRKNESL